MEHPSEERNEPALKKGKRVSGRIRRTGRRHVHKVSLAHLHIEREGRLQKKNRLEVHDKTEPKNGASVRRKSLQNIENEIRAPMKLEEKGYQQYRRAVN